MPASPSAPSSRSSWARTTTAKRVGIGEIVALELEQRPGTSRVVVQAFDRSHRLHRGRRVRTFQEMSDGDVVSRIASDAGLQTDIDGADAQHDYLIQDNQTDYAFLAERALLTGLELSVDDETIRFKRPEPAGAPIEIGWDTGLHAVLGPRVGRRPGERGRGPRLGPDPEAGDHLDRVRQRRRAPESASTRARSGRRRSARRPPW